MDPNTKYAELFEQLEQEARDNRRGMWSDPDMVQDIEAELPEGDHEQEAIQSESSYRYVASKNSQVFHLPSCRWAEKIVEGSKIHFGTLSGAMDSGRRACKVCKPDESKDGSGQTETPM